MSILKLSLLSSLKNRHYIYTPKPFPPPHHNPHSSSTSQSGVVSNHPIGRRNYSVVATSVVEDKKPNKTLWKWMGLVIGMVGVTYASVSFYRRLWQGTCWPAPVQRRETVEEKIARHAQEGTAPTREIVVQFNADVADGMQWKFIPTQSEVRVKPGESALAFYTAESRSSSPITGVSTYNVTPTKAGKYFHKTACFCFEKLCLLPGEQIDMPVFFYIDPEIETDPTLDGVDNMMLSYTFFQAPDK